MQETQVWSLILGGPTSLGTTKPERHNYWACALEPQIHSEKAPQWETHALQLESSPYSAIRQQAEQQWRPRTAKNK